jgi:hypothetical protein
VYGTFPRLDQSHSQRLPEAIYSEVQWLEREANNSPTSSFEVNEAVVSSLPYTLPRWHLDTVITLPLPLNIVSRFRLNFNGVLDWLLDLLTTYTQLSGLQVISATSLISIFYKSPQHAESFPACCVFNSCSQVTASNSGDSSDSALKFSLIAGSLPSDSFL